LKDLEAEKLEFILADDFSIELKREFSKEDDESAKVAKLKKVKQRTRMMEKLM